jgi:magnesium-transporting ATPase (P-type)
MERRSENWHAQQSGEVLERLQSRSAGLSTEEAERRLAEHGPNELPPPTKRGPVARFLYQFHNVLIYVLLAAAAVTAFLGHWLDMGVILGVVVINALIGFIQEGKAERALESLREMLSPQATVLRDGEPVEIAAVELVPGDVVLIDSGDKVPGDLRLLECKNLKIEESALTGESEAVDKSVEPVAADTELGDRRCLAFSSTLVTYGVGKGVVVATGSDTEIGKISAMLAEVESMTTPLLQQTARFGRWLTVVILALSVLTFLFGWFLREYELAELFLSVVALAVAAIPEGLPAIMTIALALGVQRMAGRNAIIRRLPAIETLGAVSIIFTDKTGTLTRNEMTVKMVLTSEGAFDVEGTGYQPEGRLVRDGSDVSLDDYPVLRQLIRAGVGCNDSRIVKHIEHGQSDESAEPGRWKLQGEPTEGALVVLGMKVGFGKSRIDNDYPRIDAVPFESEHRYMATLHRLPEGDGAIVFVKGGPERVLGMCDRQLRGESDEPLDAEYWQRESDEIAARGQRVLALAQRPLSDMPEVLNPSDVEEGLVFLGYVGIFDPPREEAVRAVQDCQAAGIIVKMVTGDHALTARAIGHALGLVEEDGPVMTGRELEQADDEELDRIVPKINIYARASPEHKLRLVKAVQENGQIVAMTGDGVNDAPALKRADVGVAMGIKGTEVSKDSAAMVLADDNFASIAHAVEEGRAVYDNLRKTILFLLPTNGGQASIILCAILLGLTMPLTPVQALWVNMVSAVTLALALAFEPPEHGVMQRPPRDPREPMLPGYFLWRIAAVSFLLLITALGLFYWELHAQDADLSVARTATVNMIFFGQAFYLFNTRFVTASSFRRAVLVGNGYVWISVAALIIIQLFYTYAPFMQRLFGSGPLSPQTWLIIMAAGFAIFVLVEIEKRVIRGNSGKRRPRSRENADPEAGRRLRRS